MRSTHNSNNGDSALEPFVRGIRTSAAEVLRQVRDGTLSVEQGVAALDTVAVEEIEAATIDHDRAVRKGLAEVIYCAGKTADQVARIAECLAKRTNRLLGTRCSPEQFAAAQALVPELQYDPLARCLYLDPEPHEREPGIAIVAAGTSDLPVATEAAITLRVMGHQPLQITDVGVAGLHRLLRKLPEIHTARVVIVVAGMEGALPSVVAGLIPAPVIAVPTSVGYGASFQGLAALLAMLNSCASGISVVNIDNGFGAAYMAAAINNQCLQTAAAAVAASR